MSGRTTIKAIVQAIILSGVILSCTIGSAQSEFTRISFVDPYWVSLNGHIPGSGSTTFYTYNYYWPQMDSCGFTHTVTHGTGTSFGNPADLYLLNGNVGDPWRYAKGVVNDYPVGGPDSYFDPNDMETGENFSDTTEFPPRQVFQMLCNRDSAGIVIDSSFPGWHQFMPRDYWFTFTMKMDGDTSAVDPVAEIHIWEELEQFKDYIGHLNGLLWEDLWDISGPPKADRIDTIYSTDFKHPGEYELVELKSIGLIAHDDSSHKQYKTLIEFKWLGTRDLYIDNLNVRDTYNYRLFVSSDSSYWYDYIQDRLQAQHNLAGGHPERNFRFYLDEPHVNMYRSYAKVDTLSKEKPGVPLNGATACDPPQRDPLLFAQMIDSDELLYNFYTIKPWVSCSSYTFLDTLSLQHAWDYLINVDNSKRKGMRYATKACTTEGKDFWMTVQACSEYHVPTDNWWFRAPTPNELRAEASLALCYGAKGIMYYLYPSFEADDGWRTHGLVDIVNDYGDPWELNASSRYVPNERWYAAQEINAKIDSLSDVLLSLNWQDAFVSHPNTIASHATFVESLYSAEFGTDTSYVEIGVFEHDDGSDYLMLVNRRCLSSETQAVTVWLDTDAYMIQDAYNRDVYGNDEGVFAGITLAPGEGRLFKLVDSDAAWAGTISVQSSVTIPQGVQLTIEPDAEIKFAENAKLQINGVLNAIGPEDSFGIYFTAIDTTKIWNGICFGSTSVDSLCIIKNCCIKYASEAIQCNGSSPDTIDNLFIKNCDYGIYCQNNSSPRISSVIMFMWNEIENVGIYCSGSSDPTIDSVWLYGNEAVNSKGIQIHDSDPIIRGGTICNFERGISICGGDPYIYDVTLTDNAACGISCNWSPGPGDDLCAPCSASIAQSRIYYNLIGVISANAAPILSHNKLILNDSTGVYCSGTTTPKLGKEFPTDADSGYNEICNNIWNVFSECSGTVKAENNWWGLALPDTNKFYGDVDYIPYLFQSPDSVPPARITDLIATLVDSCIALQWSAVSIDTTGKEEPVNFYVIYRDTTAGFFSPPPESLVVVGTTGYIDCGVVGDVSVNYFYSVRAVDYGLNFSLPSNQVGEFDKYLTKDGGEDIPEPPED